MNYQKNLFGLPPMSVNLLSGGVFIFIVCLGIRTARSPEIDLKVANTQLVIGSSVSKLSDVAAQLEQQALAIKQKDEAYAELNSIYQQSLKGKEGYGKLQKAIEIIDVTPSPDDISEIRSKISETESDLLGIEGGD